MDKMWLEEQLTNKIVKNLADHGQDWTDLPEHLIDDLVKRHRVPLKAR
jgi:hypothetical protein